MIKAIVIAAGAGVLTLGFTAHSIAQVPFSYPPHVVAAAEEQKRVREQEWRQCFASSLATVTAASNPDWHIVARVFNACGRTETRYVRASLIAAQKRFPEPRTDQYGRIVAWDRLSNTIRYSRRAEWVQIRHEMEFAASSALSLPPRCVHRYTNYATAGGYYCAVSDTEMGMMAFDVVQID